MASTAAGVLTSGILVSKQLRLLASTNNQSYLYTKPKQSSTIAIKYINTMLQLKQFINQQLEEAVQVLILLSAQYYKAREDVLSLISLFKKQIQVIENHQSYLRLLIAVLDLLSLYTVCKFFLVVISTLSSNRCRVISCGSLNSLSSVLWNWRYRSLLKTS